jgi:hypothetical protein
MNVILLQQHPFPLKKEPQENQLFCISMPLFLEKQSLCYAK